MKIFKTISEIRTFLDSKKHPQTSVGFVPTMGALHIGHGSLIEKAKSECSLTVASIFVNPTQFNNPSDFEKYPNTLEKDIEYLEQLGCDVVFIPQVTEIYNSSFEMPDYKIGVLDRLMEGLHRPGHFNGVVQVVYRLFDIVKPDKAYFGLKDYQQLAVIKNMTTFFNLPIEIIPCSTIREKDGLALSSRNLRLSPVQRYEALFIYQTLILAKELSKKLSPKEVKKQIELLYQESSLKLEYIELINPINFEVLENDWVKGTVACIVAYVGDIRLIDNMEL